MNWITPDMNDGQTIFVFGSNLAGRHGRGAALDAARFWGAKHGIGNGRQGEAYAIPTKDEHLSVLPLPRVKKFIDQFKEYAHRHPDVRFLVTEVGCGLAGYTAHQIAPFFRHAPENCVLPDEFTRIIKQREDLEQ
jgi:hypothetical protein